MYSGLYQYVILGLQKQSCRPSNVIDHHNLYFLCSKTLILAIRNGSGQTKVSLIITTLCVLVSTLLITFASGLVKIRSNKKVSLICPNLNLNQLFFDALLDLWRKRNDWRIANKTISHRWFYILNGNIPLGVSTYRISRFYAFVVLNKTMFVVSPNKPEHVFRILTPRVYLFCQMVIMLQQHNAD